MELGLDISTLAVAVIAGIWTFWTWRAAKIETRRLELEGSKQKLLETAHKSERDALEAARKAVRRAKAEERQKRQDAAITRTSQERDLAEAHAIHQELTSHEVSTALLNAQNEADKNYLLWLHERLEKRHDLLVEAHERSVDQESSNDSDAVEEFAPMITAALERVRLATNPPSDGDADRSKPARDFTKYSWDGSQTKFGKGGILHFIGATFTKRQGITTTADFIAKFGDVVESVLKDEVAEYPFDRKGLITPLLFEGQRERYAISNRRWRDAHGEKGVMTLDGTEYLVSWGLGFTGAKVAPLQKKLIEHFTEVEHYPIVELDRG